MREMRNEYKIVTILWNSM